MKTKQLAFASSLLALLLIANPQVFGQRTRAGGRPKNTTRATGRAGSAGTTATGPKTSERMVTNPKGGRVLSGADSKGKKKKPIGEPSPSLPKDPPPTPTPTPKRK